jgi:hypothetical protein
MSSDQRRTGRHVRLKFGTVIMAAFSALACMLPPAAFGANPIEEMAKQNHTVGGGMDPHGDSWLSMQHSLEQFLHPEFVLRLFLSLSLAVACAWVVAWHPRRSTRLDSLSDLEERKTLVILGVVGAIVAGAGRAKRSRLSSSGLARCCASAPRSTIRSSPAKPS